MRLHLGGPPKSPDFVPDSSWKRLREPSSWLAQLLALPVGIVSTLLLAWCWYRFTPLHDTKLILSPSVLLFAFLNMPVPSFLLLVLGTVGLFVIHELLHAVVLPKGGLSSATVLGCWPSRFLVYTHYLGELSRNRFIAVLLTPFLVVSIAPLLLAIFAQFNSGWTAFASCFNAFASCMDLLGTGVFLVQIPHRAIVRNQGWQTYWRESEATPV